MKRFVKICAGLASMLALTSVARADDVVSSNNPYAPIAARNVFGLNPPSLVIPSSSTKPNESAFKIYCTGLTSISGRWQVLFSVSGPSKLPGSQTGEALYIMSEGEQRDDIKVVHIDPKACLISFDNHGIVQQIHLAERPTPRTPPRFQTPSQILFQMEHPNES